MRFTRGFRGPSGAAATRHSSVSSAASSAVIGVRFDAPARDRPRVVRSFERCAGTAGRAGSAGPVDPRPQLVRLASEAAKWEDGRPDASLEVSCPLQRSPATSRLCAGRRHLSGDPASTVDLRRRPPSPLVSRSRGRCIARCSDTRRATPCTHAPATLAVLAVLRLAELARSTLRGSTPRVLAGTLRRSRRVAASHASEPAASHAPALSFFSRRSATRGSGYVAWSGPFSAVEACLGFRPVNLAGNEAGLSSRV